MATRPRTTGLTYEDLERMFPEQDMVRRDLIDGELFVTPSPTIRHQDVVGELFYALRGYAKEHGGMALASPLDVHFSDTNVLEPDVLYVGPEHRNRIGERYLTAAPDLVIEVSSPSTRSRDLTRKKDVYERHGVPEYWFVDLDAERIEIYRLEDGRYGQPVLLARGQELTSPLLPGFALAVDTVLGATA